MTTVSTPNANKGAASTAAPYLSYSRLNRYLLCPEQYRLYYIERLRLRIKPAALAFGSAVHDALAALFSTGDDPVQVFLRSWDEVKQVDLDYRHRESWEKFQASGRELLTKFMAEELPRLRNVIAVEKRFSLTVTGLDLPLVGILDLMADLDGKSTVVDFKTSGSAYDDHEAALSDQLTTYLLAEPNAEQAALCVLVKTKDPKIEWHIAQRTPAQRIELLDKTHLVAGEIEAGHFYKRSGKWCGWCDYLPVCTGDQQRVNEILVQIQ